MTSRTFGDLPLQAEFDPLDFDTPEARRLTESIKSTFANNSSWAATEPQLLFVTEGGSAPIPPTKSPRRSVT